MQTSESIRARLRILETAVENSGTAVISARAAYDRSIRHAVLSNEHDAVEHAHNVLRAAERTHGSACDMADRARQLLSEKLAEEQRAARLTAQSQIEVELETLASTATKLDSKFAEVVSELLTLYRSEIALHKFAKTSFLQAPLTAPRTLAIARSFASALTFLANQGEAPEAQPHAATAAARAADNVRGVYDA